MLDDLQAGHLRRMIDLSEQLPDDWSGMMGRSALQEDFGGLRFQLAYMSYALALCHIHRLPAAPAVFRRPFDSFIQKMLSPDVWTYWRHVSTGNGPFNKSLGELPAQWNPVETDNIMYSAYVQSMALLYHYLFRDPKYAAERSLAFKLEPLFWGAGGQRFDYDEKSLNRHIYWMMVEKGYLGIACEPNCVYQICNQPAILGFRLHDFLYGGTTADEVTEGYRRAWDEFGIVDDAGHFSIFVLEREHAMFSRRAMPWADFWLGSLMHMWDPAGVEAAYPRQMEAWAKPGPEDSLWIPPSILPPGFGPPEMSHAHDFGWAAVCASEVGDEERLKKFLAYADTCLTPTWNDGAFHYRRRDGWLDESGKLHAMDPHTGNTLLGYARLNVPGGLRMLYEGPLDDAWFAGPALVEMSAGLDVRTAFYARDDATLHLTLRPGRMGAGNAELTLANIWERGPWVLFADGEHIVGGGARDVVDNADFVSARRSDDNLVISLPITGETKLRLAFNR
jgi:hypothetical protein